jgi:hypothetical protein
MTRLGRAVANWLLILSAPIWILPVGIFQGLRGPRDRAEFLRVLTGKESLL